jgi:hypothetical protein
VIDQNLELRGDDVAETATQAAFRSLLFPDADMAFVSREPECFHDLGLDQLVDAITATREEYDLVPIYRTPVRDVNVVTYRQKVYADLAQPRVHEAVMAFAEELRLHRARVEQAAKLYAQQQRPFWMLSGMLTYHSAVRAFSAALAGLPLQSEGVAGLRDWLAELVGSEMFVSAEREGRELRAGLDGIHVTVRIDGLRVEVAPFADEPDYSAEVEATFARFRQGDVKDHLVKFRDDVDVDRVEEGILQIVVQENPDLFATLNEYVTTRQHRYLDPTIARVDRELQFYLSYREHLAPMIDDGLEFCMPDVSAAKEIAARHTFDLALATRMGRRRGSLVTNDIELREGERLIVVTGANQGGKTTFSRTFGQLHWLAELGLPVPGESASLFAFDTIYTHYERQEDVMSLRGKLEDELVRVHDILERATSDSIVILNEIFSSTTLDDAVLLGTAVLRQLIERDVLAVCVTFVDELSTLSDTTVSLVAAVNPDEPTKRTLKLVRRPADGLAYALALADKYRLRGSQIVETIAEEQNR